MAVSFLLSKGLKGDPNVPIHSIETQTLGECWLSVSRLILTQGQPAHYAGAPMREIANLTLSVLAPDENDPLIRQYGDPAWLAWMHANFFTQKPVAELGDAPSYAFRLFNYAGQGRDQLQWVIDRLRADPEGRDAAITTFMPLTDTSYIPCISLLDFWIPQQALDLVVYAHSLDFGKKAYGNLVELACLQKIVADGLGRPVGQFVLHVKTAHIYEPEFEFMQRLVRNSLDSA
jgi:thymidylate synthase